VLLVPALIFGDWVEMGPRALQAAGFSGIAFAFSIGGLYKAFSLAPVRIVSPIIGSYPMMSLAIAALQGSPVSSLEWLAVAAIVVGIAIVTLTADTGADVPLPTDVLLQAMFWAAASAVGFSLTFAFGQDAARNGSELPAILIARGMAFGVMLLALIPRQRVPIALGGEWKTLALMGVMDAMALGAVMAAGGLPKAEYASVSSGLFGVLTILLAAKYLGEKVSPVQWAGVLVVFSGVGGLSLQL
jgi:drug/metabolite transporter (DMT)-like permease